MKQRPRIYYTESQKALMWDRWQKGDSLQQIVILCESETLSRDFPDRSMGVENLDSCSPNELAGFVEVFGGKLDKTIAVNNKTNAIKLWMNFANERSERPDTAITTFRI
jgi:hypothetical protein